MNLLIRASSPDLFLKRAGMAFAPNRSESNGGRGVFAYAGRFDGLPSR